jgi:ribosomal-protein-alanine N-acetyltransferase
LESPTDSILTNSIPQSALIRRARSEDLPALLQIIAPLKSTAFNWSEDNFLNEFSFAHTWVYCKDEQILAFICLRDANVAWEISVLAAASKWQRRGVMEAFLCKLFAILADRGDQRHFWLEVHESNVAAQKLYLKLGFQNDGRRGGYYSDGSAALLMSRPPAGLKT